MNGNSVTGFDGLDVGEPTYISTGTAVTAAQTTIPLARTSFTTITPYVGHVYYVSNLGSGTNDGSAPWNSITFAHAMTLVGGNPVDSIMNWIVLTGNITSTDAQAYPIPANREVTITSNGGTPYTITLGQNISGDPFLDVVANATLNLMDVTIRGGGVYIYNGTMNFNGAASIVDNITDFQGGGLFLDSLLTVFNLVPDSQSITDNTIILTDDEGSGVYIMGSTAGDLAETALIGYVINN